MALTTYDIECCTTHYCCAVLEIGNFPFGGIDPATLKVDITTVLDEARTDYDNVNSVIATVRADEQEATGKVLLDCGFVIVASLLNSNGYPVLLFCKNLNPTAVPDWAEPKKVEKKKPNVQHGRISPHRRLPRVLRG